MPKAYVSNGILRPIRRNETNAACRTVVFAYATGKTIASIDVSKAGGQFADGTSTCTEIDDHAGANSGLYALVLSAADIDTIGALGVEMNDGTDEIYLEGIRVVQHDPFRELTEMEMRVAAAQ